MGENPTFESVRNPQDSSILSLQKMSKLQFMRPQNLPHLISRKKILPHRKNSDQCFQARQKRAIVTEKFHHFTANLSKTWQLSLNSWVQIWRQILANFCQISCFNFTHKWYDNHNENYREKTLKSRHFSFSHKIYLLLWQKTEFVYLRVQADCFGKNWEKQNKNKMNFLAIILKMWFFRFWRSFQDIFMGFH